ncbi:hypothetical protein H8E07_13365 [bacterium]|nr:hypothetical protein [bacterium]
MTRNDEIRKRLEEYPSATQSHADIARLLAENERQAERIVGLVCALHQIESITIVWRSGDEADRLREINDTAGAALRGGAEALEAR